MKVRRKLAAAALAVGLFAGPTADFVLAVQPAAATSPVGWAELPNAWGSMRFQIQGTGTWVNAFSGWVFNSTPNVYFAVRAGIYWRQGNEWIWPITGWSVLAPCWAHPYVWRPGRFGRGGFMPPGDYSMIVQVVEGAFWGESAVTWTVHR